MIESQMVWIVSRSRRRSAEHPSASTSHSFPTIIEGLPEETVINSQPDDVCGPVFLTMNGDRLLASSKTRKCPALGR